MRFLIVGPGAMGCLLASLLARGGLDVAILDYRSDRAKRLMENGITLEGVSGDYFIKLPVYVDELRKIPDVVLFCVKAYKTSEAATHLKKVLSSKPIILTLQNGVGNLEILEDIFGKESVTAGVTSEGATLLGEGHVRHAGFGETIIGKASIPEAIIGSIAEGFNRSGLKTRWLPDVTGLIWGKLLINVGINGLTALLRVKNGVLYREETLRSLMKVLVEEAYEVIVKKGIELPFPDPVQKVYEVAQNTAQNISSMLQDVLKQRRTEIGFMNGAVVREGKKLGVSTPFNEAIFNLVSALEKTFEERL